MNVFHGTTVACANKIMKDTFHITKFDAYHPGKMPNDLGTGVYTYCQDEEGLWNPYQNALRYAQCYRNNWGQEKCFSVISISISDDSSLKILDLDNKTNAKRFEEIRQALIKRINKVYKKIPSNGAWHRKNKDGIALEIAFNKKILPEPDLLIKKTYTAFDKGSRSNFPNGCELVIRNLNIIESKKILGGV